MNRPAPRNVVLVVPGEAEVSLLAELSRRRDVRVIGVVDPSGQAMGSSIAEVLGIPVFASPDAEPLRQAEVVVYPEQCAEAEPLVRAAAALGFVPQTTAEFQRLLAPPAVTVQTARPAPRNFERLERETESIHRTLSRIEEALQRESLLRWLLSLATRAVQATSGSIMLYNEKSEQLYIAGAYGLSEATQHSTRLALGHGIAGRVAQKRRSELVVSRPQTAEARDRPEIAAAISAPLVYEDRLIGVINVSVAAGDRLLDEEDLATIDRLARRLGLILHRFLGLQRAREGELLNETDRELQECARGAAPLGEILACWSGALAARVGATRLSLAIVCEDGTLLTAERASGGAAQVAHESPDNPAWSEVLQTGRPLAVRELGSGQGGTEGGWTVFYLPIGNEPVQAVLTAGFAAAQAAHRFHDLSGEIIYLLEKRLPELISRFSQRDRLDRFAILTAALSDIAAAAPDAPEPPLALLTAAACRLTGARAALVVARVENGVVHLAPGQPGAEEPWLARAGRLLEEAAEGGWRTTVLSDSPAPRLEETCLLAVTAQGGAAAPGLLLRGKERLHALDGAVFTEFDAELAGRLARLLPVHLRPRPAATPEAPAAPSDARGAAEEDARIGALLDLLRREMDRCDRYHTAFSLSVMRPLAPIVWDDALATELARTIMARVRSSDLVTSLPDGTLVLLAPEEIQAVVRLERRLRDVIRQATAEPGLEVQVGHSLYPGRQDDPQSLLDAAFAALEPLA